MDKKTASEALAKKVQEFKKALAEAEAIADESGLSFRICPTYGMGGTYEGRGDQESWESSSCEYDSWDSNGEWGWFASSQSC